MNNSLIKDGHCFHGKFLKKERFANFLFLIVAINVLNYQLLMEAWVVYNSQEKKRGHSPYATLFIQNKYDKCLYSWPLSKNLHKESGLRRRIFCICVSVWPIGSARQQRKIGLRNFVALMHSIWCTPNLNSLPIHQRNLCRCECRKNLRRLF